MAARRSPLAWAALVLTLLVAGWVFWESQRLIRADFASMAARQQITAWVAEVQAPRTAEEWQSARAAIDTALAIVPDDPSMHDARGDVHMVGGTQPWSTDAQRQGLYQEAIASYQASLALRPTEAQTWASLASAYFAANQTGAPLHEAWAKALALGRYEGQVQPILMDIAFATWSDASPQMRQWVFETFATAPEASQATINKIAQRRGISLAPGKPEDAASAAGPSDATAANAQPPARP